MMWEYVWRIIAGAIGWVLFTYVFHKIFVRIGRNKKDKEL